MSSPSPPSKHNMKPQNLIPPSLLIFGPLGGYDCGAALTAASRRQKGNGLPNDIFVAHPSRLLPLRIMVTSISGSLIISRKKEGTLLEHESRKMRVSPICQNIDLSSSHASFGPNGKRGKRGGKRAPERETKKLTCSSNFENTGYIFPARVRP